MHIMKSLTSKMAAMIISLLLLAIILPACDSGTEKEAKSSRTIIDQRGKRVKVPGEINRIVTLPIPLPSMIVAVDGNGKRIVGMHPKSKSAVEESTLKNISPELMNVSTAFVQEGFTVNIEELVKLQPDVVFQWKHQPEEIEKIENAGIPVIALQYGTQQDLEAWLKILGELLDKKQQVNKIINYHHEVINDIRNRTSTINEKDKPRVMYLNGPEPSTNGGDSYNHFWITASGGCNVAADIEGTGKYVNMEQVLRWNPEIIYIGNFCNLQADDLFKNKIQGQDWSHVAAVKNRRVYKIPLAGYRWDPPSVESPLMLKWLAQKHYPEIFADYSMAAELKEFYRNIYNYELSDEEVARVLKD